ncbi:AraC family transcriptional regulator [Pedobacter nototheniae]|uniref:helix-turn-helix domain-containing protein n=1 Tax=Pedobacter nototheniae TaxID=2488994 RepID=UPI0029315005|nr:AraC family transcriptional regulator [Pedobacter nototheniae]
MKITEIKSCYVGPAISPEQFIAEHFFLFLAKGIINGYDGNKNYSLKPGESCLIRKNRLARYNKQKENGEFEKVVIIFDEEFLKEFQVKHRIVQSKVKVDDTFIPMLKSKFILDFVQKLSAFYKDEGKIDEHFSNKSREELLLILLEQQPELASVLFNFSMLGKINLEEFMNRNYKFNVNLERFAYLTGRSLSSFKRDFKIIFNKTPNRWLIQKRLQEAHFLINNKKQKSSDIYLDLGFADLSHFSYAFKKEFGLNPTEFVK